MKHCDNCFETNSDGATNCVICGEPLDVPQTEQPEEALAEDHEGPPNEADDVGADPTVVTETLDTEGVEQAAAATGVAMEEHEAAEAPSPETEAEDWEAADAEAAEEEYEAVEAQPPEAETEEEAADAVAIEEQYDDIEAQPPEEEAEETPLPEAEPEGLEAAATAATAVKATDVAPPPPAAAPASGHAILQVFHDTESRVVHTHPVVNDVTLIGREDPQRDVFPDVDLTTLAHLGVSATHASRQHLRLLRQGNEYYLFIYRGTTGTQVNKDLIDSSRYGKRFPVQVGDRIILGSKVRLKLTCQE